ncbi:MAG: SusD/RagB family nutrient-binding outer membrane lipoprotein, partial [Hymenobacter sp.]
MKLPLKTLAAAALAMASSGCSSFLDINDNPNSLTTNNPPTPAAILAQALSTTATLYTGGTPSYNSYSMFAADYVGKSGIVNGYAEERTYNYTSTYYQGLWSGTYDNLNDYNTIQVQGTANNFPFHAAIARIMKVYDYLLLVDQYGDIPYTNALKGASNLSPTYDKAADIYRDLIVQLTGAISDINAATTKAADPNNGVVIVGAEDIVFGGGTAGMTNWQRFANSLKLRILLRESQTNDAALNTYVATQIAALQSAAPGFITTDVVVQPGYQQSSGQQNPFYSRYGITVAGTSAGERYYQFPTRYILAQYTTNNDPRVSQLYTTGVLNGVTTYNGTDAGETAPPTLQAPSVGSRFALSGGLLKGFNAPTVLMFLSEHLFNKAEAETRNLYPGGDTQAKLDYENAILASFLSFYRPATTTPATVPATPATSAAAGASQYVTFMAAAVTSKNPRVSYSDAPSTGALGKQYVILYQKYLAMNTVAATEGWADFRRAAQPKIEASLQASVAGRFPKRLLYPQTEVNTNATNV